MDFAEAVTRAKLWTTSNSHGVTVSSTEENERRIVLRHQRGSFFITVPHNAGQDEWGVWSDEEECIGILSVAMDQLSKPSNTLEGILERVVTLLQGSEVNSDEASEEEESEDEEFDDYYDNDDDIDLGPNLEPSGDSASAVSANSFFTGQGSPAAVHRLIADLKSLSNSASKFGISAHPVEDNLFEWTVELSGFPTESLLGKDLQRYAERTNRKPVVAMEMKFPGDYPMNPPFVRILRPRFKFLTGHVTIGGSICMKMLTRSGWSPSNDIESTLIQIRAEIMSDSNTRLDQNGQDRDYSEQEAQEAFERMVTKYGWRR